MTQAFEPEDLAAALIAREPRAAADPDAIRIVRAPGRVNRIGEYTDINSGLVLPAAIDREIRIAYVPSGDRRVELTRLDDGDTGGFELDVPRRRPERGRTTSQGPPGRWPRPACRPAGCGA